MEQKSEKKSTISLIIKEFAGAFFDFIFDGIYTKIGWSMLLSLVGIAFLFAPMADESEKPSGFFSLGLTLIIIAILLFFYRIFEIRKYNKK